MREIHDDGEVKTIVWEAGEQILVDNSKHKVVEVRPIVIHVKMDGTLENQPSFMIESTNLNGIKVLAQVSLKKMMHAIAAALGDDADDPKYQDLSQ